MIVNMKVTDYAALADSIYMPYSWLFTRGANFRFFHEPKQSRENYFL